VTDLQNFIHFFLEQRYIFGKNFCEDVFLRKVANRWTDRRKDKCRVEHSLVETEVIHYRMGVLVDCC